MMPQVRSLVLSYMEGLDCARSLSISLLIKAGEWDQLFSMKCDPRLYSSAEEYRAANCATELLRKLDCPELLGLDLEAIAIEKWWWAEQECFKTNRRLNEIFDFGTLLGLPVEDGILLFFQDLRKNLHSLIGSGPRHESFGRFGPGATVSDRSQRVTVADKMTSVPTLTSSAWPYLIPWTGTQWAGACARRGDEPRFVKGNHYFTVPKSATSKRSCGKEPSLNVYFQLGLGSDLRRKLKASGIDLDDGQNVHRQVACVSSKTGDFCTIDLSSASDTLCTALVRGALPRRWHSALYDLRSPFTRVKGKWVKLEKFSSMGNGYTFELETAVFTAICMTADPRCIPGVNLFVYGDDIIVPTESSRSVLAALRFCGFTPNGAKTFTEGVFRESCGGDFFDGEPVRAHYLKELPHEPQHFISLANGINRVLETFPKVSPRRAGLRRAWFRVLDQIPTHIRACRGPQVLGDLVIHDDETRWSYRWRATGIRWIRVYRPARFRGPRFKKYNGDVQLATALYGIRLRQSGSDDEFIVARDGVTGYKVGWAAYS
jgi:hypothetical protein